VVDLVPKLKLGHYEQENESPFGPTLAFPAADVAIPFIDGVADFIDWWVPIDDSDEYVWPRVRVAA
jgi:hypothetical protein